MGEHRAVRLGAPLGGRGARLTSVDGAASTVRVCRVLPDVTAVERVFDYLVPDELVPTLAVGTVVRVVLHGRRVRGWVVALDVTSDVDPARLRPIVGVVSAGPPPDVVALSEWIAHRWVGPRAAVLRSASAPNNVEPARLALGGAVVHPQPPAGHRGVVPFPAPSSITDTAADELAARVLASQVGVVRWPPRADRRRLVARLLAPVGSTIVLTADGDRAHAFARWLDDQGVATALLHSDRSPAARTDAWRQAARGSCVVVGGRMAALAPVPDLGAVVVLDDDDEALQEERSPTWHARDVAFERARRCGAHAYVVSPAPSVQVSNEVPGAFAPAHAFEVEGWPRVDVVDQRELPPGSGLLSEPLVDAVRATVERGVLAVIVQNRRGGVRLLRCDACHELTRWDANGRPLWDHDTPADIELKPTFCIHCGGMRLRVLSGGVQRLANHLALRLAGHDVAVVDAAVPTAPEAAVLVGTEAVLHRREVRRRRPGLVAFVDFDAELFAARYRASEQALWLIVRAAHVMAAAPRHETRVLLQTHQPDHPVVVAAREGCPEVFLVEEARRRVSYDLPPHSALAHVRADDPVVDAVHAALSETHWSQRGVGADRTEGQLLVRAPDADVLAEALEVGLGAARAVGTARVVVDPPRI